MLLSTAPETGDVNLPEVPDSTAYSAANEALVAADLTGGDSAPDSSVMPYTNCVAQPDVDAVWTANGLDRFGNVLAALLGTGADTIPVSTVDASGGLPGAGPANGSGSLVSPDGSAAPDAADESPVADTVSDLVPSLAGLPLDALGGPLPAPQVTMAEVKALPAPPPGGPGGGVIQVYPAPVITSFAAVAGEYGSWIFEGKVEHEAPETLTIVFGGVLAGRTTRVNPDGTFSYSAILPPGTTGVVSAQAFDPDGVASSVAYDWVG